MKKQPKPTIKTPDLSSLSAAELRLMVAQFQAVVEEQNASLLEHKSELKAAHRRIELLEEMNRLLKTQKFSASSEKSKFQLNLFDEYQPRADSEALMGLLDSINHSGLGKIWFAGRGTDTGWQMKREMLSPSYMTRWDSIPSAMIN